MYSTAIPVQNQGEYRPEFRNRKDTGQTFISNPLQRIKNSDVAAPFRDSRKDEVKLARRGLASNGPFTQLLAAIRGRKATPAMYSLTVKDLGLSKRYADGVNIFDADMVADIKDAIRRIFTEYVFYSVEVGDNRHINVHIVAGLWDALPDLQRGVMGDGVPVEVITPGTEERVLKYLYKALPQLPRLMVAHDELVASGGTMPKRHGYLNRPRPRVGFSYKTWRRRWQRDQKRVGRDESKSSLSVRLMGKADERRQAIMDRYVHKKFPPLEVEIPVILKGQPDEQVQVERLFKLYQQRELNGVTLALPDGILTHDLEAAVAPLFGKWCFVPSQVLYLAEVMRTLENTLQGRRTRSWRPTAPPVSRRKSRRYRSRLKSPGSRVNAET